MRVPISEARRRLPALVKELQGDPAAVVEITVRDEPVAELRALPSRPQPGEAARRLLALRRRLSGRGRRGDPADVSQRVKGELYGPRGIVR